MNLVFIEYLYSDLNVYALCDIFLLKFRTEGFKVAFDYTRASFRCVLLWLCLWLDLKFQYEWSNSRFFAGKNSYK